MLGIGRKIKKSFPSFIIKYVKKNFSKKVYSFFLFLSVIRKFKKDINKQKKNDKFSDKLDKINHYEYRITSQNNEDGIIEYIFSKVSNNKFFVELGFDFFECNSLNLIKNGWNGILIDADEDKCLKMERCLKFFYPENNVKILNKKIYRENINELIFQNINVKQIDFLSIDIDGNDYWVLEKIDTNNINVICNEYNPWLGNNSKKVIPYDKNFTYDYCDKLSYYGGSLLSYVNLLKSKNFDLIAVDSSGTNAFHVKREFLKHFEILSATGSFRKASKFYSDKEISKIENDTNNYNFIDLNI